MKLVTCVCIHRAVITFIPVYICQPFGPLKRETHVYSALANSLSYFICSFGSYWLNDFDLWLKVNSSKKKNFSLPARCNLLHFQNNDLNTFLSRTIKVDLGLSKSTTLVMLGFRSHVLVKLVHKGYLQTVWKWHVMLSRPTLFLSEC